MKKSEQKKEKSIDFSLIYPRIINLAFELKSPSRIVSFCPYSPFSPKQPLYIVFLKLYNTIYCTPVNQGIIGHKILY